MAGLDQVLATSSLLFITALVFRLRNNRSGNLNERSKDVNKSTALCSTCESLKVEWPCIPAESEGRHASTIDAIEHAVELINDQGVCWVPGVLPPHLLAECFRCATKNFDSCLQKVERDSGHKMQVGIANGFQEIVQRHPGRFDMP